MSVDSETEVVLTTLIVLTLEGVGPVIVAIQLSTVVANATRSAGVRVATIDTYISAYISVHYL